MTKIIDTHAHYDDERFDNDRDGLLMGMKEQGVDIIVNASASVQGCMESMKLAEKYEFVYSMAGIHPSDVLDLEIMYEITPFLPGSPSEK